MANPNSCEASPVDPVRPETLQALSDTMQQMVLLPLKRGSKPDRATLTFESESPDFSGYDYCALDFDTERPDSLGSGQVVMEDPSIEYVVWTKTEAGVVSELGYTGQSLIPFGYISEITTDPNNPEENLSRIVLPTTSGKVIEINEGRYLGDDQHTVRELSDQATQDLTATMQSVLVQK